MADVSSLCHALGSQFLPVDPPEHHRERGHHLLQPEHPRSDLQPQAGQRQLALAGLHDRLYSLRASRHLSSGQERSPGGDCDWRRSGCAGCVVKVLGARPRQVCPPAGWPDCGSASTGLPAWYTCLAGLHLVCSERDPLSHSNWCLWKPGESIIPDSSFYLFILEVHEMS